MTQKELLDGYKKMVNRHKTRVASICMAKRSSVWICCAERIPLEQSV